MSRETYIETGRAEQSARPWRVGRSRRVTSALGWVLFLPMYVYIAAKHHSGFTLAAVFGTPSTYIGARSEIYRFGGRLDDQESLVDMTYADEPLPKSATMPSPDVDLDPDEEHLISRFS